MTIGLFVAMEKEYSAMSALLGSDHGIIGGNDIFLVKTGMGKVNSAINATRFILEHKPDCIISTGCAGGMNPSLKVMDVLVSTEVVYHDVFFGEGNDYGQVQGLPAKYASSEKLVSVARKMAAAHPEYNLNFGLICSGDKFVMHEDVKGILEHFPDGLAADMESGSLSQTCHLFNVPFVSIRVISDSASSESDHYTEYMDFWDKVGETSFKVIRQYLESI